MKDSYHHGNLKNALIERGLAYISKEGIDKFSFRKLSEICDVSMAAPYSHFKNKEEYLDAVEEYVTQALVKNMASSVKSCKSAYEVVVESGISYISFSQNNPVYRQLFYRHAHPSIDLYPPFIVFKEALCNKIGDETLSEDSVYHMAFSYWALIQGLSEIKQSGGTEGLTEEKIKGILKAMKYNVK